MDPSVNEQAMYAHGSHNYPRPTLPVGVPADYAYNNYPQTPRHQQQHGGNPISSEWSTGLFGCCEDCSSCCLTYWCPCIAFGQIAEIADSGSSSCGASAVLYALLLAVVGCPCCYSCFYRKKLRAKFNLAENPCGDCLVHCFCESCALCQEYRELQNRGFDPALGWAGNMEKRNQPSAPGMIPTAPPVGQAMNR